MVRKRNTSSKSHGKGDIARFKNDLKSLGRTGAGFVPGLGLALGMLDASRCVNRLGRSAPKAATQAKKTIKRRIRRRMPRL